MEHLTDSQLTDLLSGAATPDLASHIDAHIDQCFDCRQLLLNLARALTTAEQPLEGSNGQDLEQVDSVTGVLELGEMVIGRRYRILGLLGEGGMGRVYRAYDRLAGTEVALKQVLMSSPPDVSRSRSPVSDVLLAITNREHERRFLRPLHPTQRPHHRGPSITLARRKTLAEEFRTLATLRHPHIVSVLDYGFDRDGRPFYTMELLPSAQPILVWSAKRPFIAQIELLLQLLDALAYLHRRGILHRDCTESKTVGVTQG